MAESRIDTLDAAVADQIAAGEVVERPSSILKELLENSLDAGATRVEIELSGGGIDLVRVRDDGAGIHPEDLVLAITRHATSKLKQAAELLDISTLGFRGEALASIAAVARVRIHSRRAVDAIGRELVAVPGEAPTVGPIGMPIGTTVEVEHLFAAVPARRKFLRSEATELGHCAETVLRLALVHPQAHIALRHGERTLLEFAASSTDERIESVLGRRGADVVRRVDRTIDGIRVRAWLGDARQASAVRGGTFVVVRRRVVSERALTQVVSRAYESAALEGSHPIACLEVSPPPGSVDVNVHPQKSEVRFSDPQRVYAAARAAMADLDWGIERSVIEATPLASVVRAAAAAAGSATGYRLETRAVGQDYGAHKSQARDEADRLLSLQRLDRQASAPPSPAVAEQGEGPEFLCCLPGLVALFLDADGVIAVDLLRLRAYLIEQRISAELGSGQVAIQGLLAPVILPCSSSDADSCERKRDHLLELGLDIERFGPDAVRIRGVPAHLGRLVLDTDLSDLFQRVIAWLRLSDENHHRAIAMVAQTGGRAPAPRLARRWLAELHAEGVPLETVPGIRRWRTEELRP